MAGLVIQTGANSFPTQRDLRQERTSMSTCSLKLAEADQPRARADQYDCSTGQLAFRHHYFMRELVYVSEGKLKQFMIGKSSAWRNSVRVEGDVKIPGIGGVKVGPADLAQDKRTGFDLNRVIAELESSNRAARWFADEESRPGQWVYFEAPLGYMAIGGLVIFVDCGKPADNYPTGGAIRLLLHGSRVHLIGSAPPLAEAVKRGYIGRSAFHMMMRDLNRYLAAEEAKLDAVATRASDAESLPFKIERLIDRLDLALDLEHTSAWMAGYARITAIPPPSLDRRFVIATPLYVEYISEPASGD
jgi:Family of unknown function (DUF7019)